MSAAEHGHGASSPLGNAPDVTKKANLVIWAFFIAFGVGLYLLIALVNIYFRNETERVDFLRVGSVVSPELTDLRMSEAEVLSGKRGVLDGKKNISIEDAFNVILKVTQ